MAKTYSDKLKDPRWQKKRLEIFERDSFTCQCCHSTTNTLVVHHLKYQGEPWEVENKSLVTLCEDCHKIDHEHRKTEEEELIRYFKEKGFFLHHLSLIGHLISETSLDRLESSSNVCRMLRDKIPVSEFKEYVELVNQKEETNG